MMLIDEADWANLKALELCGAAAVAIPLGQPKLLERAAEAALKEARIAGLKEAAEIAAKLWWDQGEPEAMEAADKITIAIRNRIANLTPNSPENPDKSTLSQAQRKD